MKRAERMAKQWRAEKGGGETAWICVALRESRRVGKTSGCGTGTNIAKFGTLMSSIAGLRLIILKRGLWK